MIHIMSPDELENLPNGTIVWREKYDYDNTTENVRDLRLMPMIMFNGIIANYYEYLYPDELRAADDIQLKYRYWNMKPTINIMTCTPWVKREEWIE